ncbi:MAG: hypothetical protein LC722_06405 [Actinobacteria bacterium]|nr:hypothetical protein [Actinomycetota bacterium]
MRGRPGATLLAVLLVLLVLSACDSSGDREPTTAPSQSNEDRWLSAVDGLCGALGSAQEPQTARAAFFDRSHAQLHELAAAVGERDRGAEGEILRAMSVVEEDFRAHTGPGKLEIHLGTLIRATVAGLSLIEIESPGCA